MVWKYLICILVSLYDLMKKYNLHMYIDKGQSRLINEIINDWLLVRVDLVMTWAIDLLLSFACEIMLVISECISWNKVDNNMLLCKSSHFFDD